MTTNPRIGTRLLFGFGLLATVFGVRPIVSAQSTTPAPFVASELTAESLAASFGADFDAGRMVGLSVAVRHAGKLVYAGGFGTKRVGSDDPVTTATPFSIGSITKQFTCAAVFLLAEEGKLSVRDRVSKYYPELTRAGDIRLLDLMNHVSGYRDYYPLDFLDRRMMKAIAPDDLIARYAGMPLDFEPGTRWSYSNTGYVILGRIVERVSGEELGAFLRRRIFDPLEMKGTTFEPREPGPEFARGHTDFALSGPLPARPEALGWIGGAGAIHSTPLDLLRWDEGLTKGRVLNPESYALMTRSRLLANGAETNYGCGLAIQERDGATILSHGGATSGFVAQSFLFPGSDSAVAYCINMEYSGGLATLGRLLPALRPEPATAPATAGESTKKPAAPRAVVPEVAGDDPATAARRFFAGLQAGDVSKLPLAEEFRYFLDADRVAGAARRLAPLGEPTKVEAGTPRERGGMAVVPVTLIFPTRRLQGLLYRRPDGAIEQLLLR